MLVLTRKPGEKIIIGDKIEMTIVEVKGDSVRIAFDAPKEIKIYRGEIYEEIASENKRAAVSSTTANLSILKDIPQRRES